MDRDQYDDHALWATLDSLQEMLAGDLAGEADEGRTEIRAVHSTVQYVDSLRGTDPGLVDEATLASISNDLTQGRDYLTNYVADREANAAVLASSVLTSINSARTTAIQSMPAPTPDEATRAAQEATDRYRDAADAEIATVRESIEALKVRLGELDEQRTGDAQAAHTSLAGLQEKITEAEQTVATQTTQLQEQIETQRTSFTEESEQRETTFKETEATRETTAQEKREQQSEQATAKLAELQSLREKARGLLEATGRDAVSGDYQVWAKKQGEIATRWNVVAIVVGLITVGALVWVVLGAQNDSTQFLVSKSTVGLIGLIVAGYAARQAAEHRAEERTAKRLGLDLAALEPFLENVEDPKELRVDIARRVFAPESSTTDEPRFAFGRRGMSLGELAEFVKVIRNPTE